jgi:glutamate/tyrosine decarboxylase-like PLP-dependent enzyme
MTMGRHDVSGFPPDLDHTMDPEDWEAFRSLGHRMIEDLVNDMLALRSSPVWQPVPSDARKRLEEPVPMEPAGPEAAYEDYRELVHPYPRGNNHPRFFGWVNGSGLPMGILADLLASAMNPSVGTFENAASLVEEQVVQWLKEMFAIPNGAGALLTSGCSMSNIIGLTVARNAKALTDVRSTGLNGNAQRMILYGSTETHTSIQKAAELLGLGSSSFRRIPVDDAYRIDLGVLEASIVEDREAGLLPYCVVGNAGTVNTGAIDDLDALADLCERFGLWLHVDGAFGALAWLCPEVRPALSGLQRADSLAFDLHKWMYLPYDVGVAFVRDDAAHRDTFSTTPPYLTNSPESDAHGTSFSDYGIELTRRFRALKVWLALKTHGVSGFEAQIRQNIYQAQYLADRVAECPELELVAPVSLNVACFRFVADGLGSEELNALNRRILSRVQGGGMALPSSTVLGRRVVIRAAVTNHRSRKEDFDLLIEEILQAGHALLGAGGGAEHDV